MQCTKQKQNQKIRKQIDVDKGVWHVVQDVPERDRTEADEEQAGELEQRAQCVRHQEAFLHERNDQRIGRTKAETNQTDSGPNQFNRCAAQKDQDQVAGQHENEVNVDLCGGREMVFI